MKAKGKHFIVTGGGNGIGRSLTLQLLAKGAQVTIADLNEVAMNETLQLAGENKERLSIYRLNVASRDEVEAFASKLTADGNAVDALINNAGIIQPFVPVNELSHEKIEQIMQVNFYGTVYMTKAFLPHLMQRPEAHIMNVGSMGGFIPFPGQTVYSASKAAVKLFTEGLYAELLGSSVGVSIAMPGAVNTNITGNSGVEMQVSSDDKGGKSYQMLQADEAAAIILRAIERKTPRVLVGKDAGFLDKFYRLMPSRAIRFIAEKMRAM